MTTDTSSNSNSDVFNNNKCSPIASNDLATLLEALPSLSLHNTSNIGDEVESAVFINNNDDHEQTVEERRFTSTGLISELIRQTSVLNTVHDNGASDDASYHSADEQALVSTIQTRIDDEQSSAISTLTTTSSSNEQNIPKHEQYREDIEQSLTDDDYEQLLKGDVKHIFILSDNGKPVFSRYGDEEKLLTLMGVMQTLISFSEIHDRNQLNYIKAGRSRIVFLHKEPLVFVLVTHLNEHHSCLLQQLNYCYYQIISTLTLSRIKHKFQVQPNFDLRRWLSNAEKKLLHNIIEMHEIDPGMMMTCAKCLTIPSNIRSQIGLAVAQTIRGQKDMIFAIILAQGHLVSIARLKQYHLHPSDLHLLINLVNSSDAFKGVEAWVPVCLPRFDPGGCLHAHISYLDDACDICLVLMTVNAENFQILSDFKQKISDKLKKNGLIGQINIALVRDRMFSDEIGCNELRYFAYKSRGLSQYTCSKLLAPYTTKEQHIRLFDLIRYVYGRLHDPSHQLKIVYYAAEYESLLGWLAPGFEMHVVFSPMVTLDTVTTCIDRILTYIKREESQLFIMKCEYF
ncbi:unnamed protein product [Didymodactylos carnosus]|uniref:Vacuolar fusion protein MON1 homolog n=1 Tax=Didymodactylos carnosus TaxID=1234261 RepID=A0A813WDK1_9BILA|nr:unnamed protein product [Didymodactylos carnosus]CAF1242496.1 unnamed protein product [Didymodactylos carnosus]CAF3638378.1 unnamed protein product [Didymodactylos carnosus]CAF4050017.1 unnamed protein product [Didymodactylos carnosus]